MSLTKADFLGGAAGAPLIEPVELPGRGTVYVRSVDGVTLDRIQEASETKMYKNGSLAALVVLHCACNEAGVPLFDKSDFESVTKLGIDILTPISEAAVKLNRIDKESIEGLQKN